jgi:hypothetical protein
VNRVLKGVLVNSLDPDGFYVSSESITENQVLEAGLLVDQTNEYVSSISNNELSSASKARVVAIVDRTADLDSAARSVVLARRGFQGKSPYAPDLVIVNEFVKREFLEACIRYASEVAVREGLKPVQHDIDSKLRKSLKELEATSQVSIFGTSELTIVDIQDE